MKLYRTTLVVWTSIEKDRDGDSIATIVEVAADSMIDGDVFVEESITEAVDANNPVKCPESVRKHFQKD